MTDRLREKLNQLRTEADTANMRADKAEAKVKTLDQTILDNGHAIKSLQVRLQQAESALEKMEHTVLDCKSAKEEAETGRATIDGLSRKITLLEGQLDRAEQTVKGMAEMLRQMDVRSEQFERQVHVVERERDQWEGKFKDTQSKYQEARAELDDLVTAMEGL
ncbi:actin filament-coating protein tropomyosin [Mycena metata]|uniref:Actin filament-coating protein tropomyosin n=1 Tax=Mycena metata TaxID=1033252 RepID=A0AAD7NIU7_9AGAR|nr:actin filament-coating protein tropomyosin [Mycena metata]